MTEISEKSVPVVGLGASAGGLQALSAFFECMPSDSGLAFVVIHHLDPDHESLMAELLGRQTSMPTELAEDQTTVEPDHVYVIPPDRFLTIEGGVLHLREPNEPRGLRLPIDRFLHSLAGDREQRAIAIILSGTGSDGTTGLMSVREHGGLVLAQDPDEAAHDGMPRSAVASGAVDRILPIAEMPSAIVDFVRHPYIAERERRDAPGVSALESLPAILSFLRAHSSIDFGFYKQGTLLRRIERRMALKHLQHASDYLAMLEDTAEEAQQLIGDFLISVTAFFRDTETFQYLETHVIPELLARHPPGRPFRVWVPACATGEEAYSLAMLLTEAISLTRRDIKLQLFASDVDERALSVARTGVYPDSIDIAVGVKRLERFFIREDHVRRVVPELRESVVFTCHDLVADAPFSRLDLIACRNLLIYLNAAAQERAFHLFHFALNDDGRLLLGTSESAGGHDALFETLSVKHRLYRRRGGPRTRPLEFTFAPRSVPGSMPTLAQAVTSGRPARLADLSQRLLVDRYAPAAVLADPSLKVLFAQGATDAYLRVPAGEAGQDLLAMLRGGAGLRTRLGTALRSARLEGKDVTLDAVIAREGIDVRISITVHVVAEEDGLLLVTFTDRPIVNTRASSDDLESVDPARQQLEEELESTRRELRQMVKDFERSSEELKTAHEESMSMNEEFQSTNEELETSKEELQSLNEELTTLNAQLQQKVDDERRISDDLDNLLSSSGIATFFFDRQLCIRRFTPAVRELFNVIATDIERPFSDLTGRVSDPEFAADTTAVLDELVPYEREVHTDEGRCLLRRLLPYHTREGRVAGLVMTFQDVTDLKAMERQSTQAQRFAQSIVDTVREPLLVLDRRLVIVEASRSFHDHFGTTKMTIQGVELFEIQDGQWDSPSLRQRLSDIVDDGTTIEAYDIELDTRQGERREMVLNARRIEGDAAREPRILLAVEDVTERRAATRALRERESRLGAILAAAPDAMIAIDEHGIVDSFNPAAEAMLGYSAEEIIGQNVDMLMPEPHHTAHDGYLARYVETGEKHIIGTGRELEALRKDGTLLPVRLSVAEFQVGERRHFSGILHDLSREKAHQEELQSAQRMEAIGRLTGGIAHDFNNLLTVIGGNLELLDMQLQDESERELLDEARDASRLGAQLTDRLLSFSRRGALAPRHVDLNALVMTTLPLLCRSLGETITVVTRLDGSLEDVLADPGQIENTLLNLAINARHAMPVGGELVVATRNTALDSSDAYSERGVEPGPYVALSVSDTGAGMSAEVQERAFEPFFSTRQSGSGFGLGLSMVHGFAKQSGGYVTIDSEEGSGTTLTLYLPAVARVNPQEPDSTAGTSLPTGDEVILLVEDDPRVSQVTRARLEKLGYSVLTASDGHDGLAELESHPEVELVLSDIVMPGGINGFDLAERALARRPTLKVLLASGFADDERDATESYTILRKPYSIDELAQALRKHLD